MWRLVRWIGIVHESEQSGSGNFLATLLFKLPLDRCGIFSELICGSARPRYKFTATIRTAMLQHRLSAISAKCAFKGTDPGIGGFGWQIFIATLTIGPKLEHTFIP